MSGITVLTVQSQRQRDAAFSIRRRVFIDEQRVPADEEFDAEDETALHVIAIMDGAPVGTGRLLIYRDWARIGRMAVLPAYRRSGAGRAIVERLMAAARERDVTRVMLHAQTQALPFYEKLGFRAFGEEFLEAGIPHREMERSL